MPSQDQIDSIDLSGQVAVVTGGGRGIGRAIAQTLAGAGASVGVMARSERELGETAALITQSGGRALAFRADVTAADEVRTAFNQISQLLGPVDLLVNNAAVIGPLGPFSENDPAAWWHAMDVNLRGAMLCTHAVLPVMMERRRGRIINVASGGGTAPLAHMSSYVVGKTALIRFTECIATETRSCGLAVFSLGPGTVRTAMAEYSLNSSEGRQWLPWFQRIFDEGLDVPPDRPAQLALALASGKADSLSGCYIQVSDNLDALTSGAAEIEKEKLYSLRVRRLGTAQVNPAAASILMAAERAAGMNRGRDDRGEQERSNKEKPS
jgi:NAD(P)-dependent dehydrogenase (short-subunit alcohol dehydrogenase family)